MPDEWIAAHYGWGEPMESQPYEPESEQESWSPSEASGIGILEKDGTVVAIGDHGPPPLVTEEPESSIDLPGGTLHSAPEAEPKAKARGKCGGKGCGRSKGSTIPRPRRCRWTCLKRVSRGFVQLHGGALLGQLYFHLGARVTKNGNHVELPQKIHEITRLKRKKTYK